MNNPANPFTIAEQRYHELVSLHQSGQLDGAALQQQETVCIVQDAQGRRWFPAPEPGHWLLWDGQRWTAYEPPAARPLPGRRFPLRRSYGNYPQAQQNKHHGWIGWAVGLFLFLVVLGAAGYVVWQTPLPEQWGLRQPAAVRLLDPPDRNTATDLALELSMEHDTPGVFYYVLPVKNSTDQLLYVIADTSAGFDGIKNLGGSTYAILDYLAQIATNKAISGTNIVRIALDYRNEQGYQVGILTARKADILAYANQTMTRDELIKVMDIKSNVSRPEATATP
jgi:hypothetical protein